MLKDLVLKNRSYRRFYEDAAVSGQTLRDLVDLARLTASSREQAAATIHPLVYAGEKRPDLPNPCLGCISQGLERTGRRENTPQPTSSSLQTRGSPRTPTGDAGITAQTILLGAVEQGLGGCILVSINRPMLKQVLRIPEKYEIVLVVALGRPREKVVIEPVGPNGDIKYWRDAEGTHHVPKRSLDDLIVG